MAPTLGNKPPDLVESQVRVLAHGVLGEVRRLVEHELLPLGPHRLAVARQPAGQPEVVVGADPDQRRRGAAPASGWPVPTPSRTSRSIGATTCSSANAPATQS